MLKYDISNDEGKLDKDKPLELFCIIELITSEEL